MLSSHFVLGALLLASGSVVAQTGLAPKKYITLPLGAILPSGWLRDQLILQNNGLAGHEHEFYNYVSNTDWTGGTSAYSSLEEAGSYWFNAMVPSGILVNNQALNSKTQAFLDYVLSHQESDGWLGPEANTNKAKYLWGRYPFFFGAIQLTEVNPTLTDRVVTAMHKFVQLANTMLKNGQGLGDGGWAQTRWEDFVIALQWLYDYHPNGNEALLIDTMERLKWTGVPWEKVFSPDLFPKTATEGIRNPTGYGLSWHGVNMAEGLKALPATYRFTHNQSDLTAASQGWDLLFQYHGRPSGIYAADEYLAGLEAIRGTELCLVVETMFSGSYLYQVIGDLKFADRVERITYNALPATITGDMWSRQYLQQENQIASQNMNPNPFPNDGAYSNVFGLEPNYPCCTVNFPQGWPKFVTNSFLATPDNSNLVQLYLGPFSTTTTLASSNKVTVNVDTIYPFSDDLTVTINAAKAYTHYVRIPSWVVGGTIAINGATAKAVSPSNGLQAVPVAAGTTKFVLHLPAQITTESRPHGSVAVQRGPLHYAYDIPRTTTVLKTNSQQPLAKDLQFKAAGPWQYAIDPSTFKFVNTPPTNGTLPSPVFDSGKPPLSITVTACLINWPTAGDTFAASPPQSPACTGAKTTITLRPFGSTKLRIAEFPVMSA
ncbi:hypothetical protein E1B28_007958 [Marasmius oreades]|uniref:Non-reducing end beta-L-arabinofuranosidase-like GH127 middle domain-containing protein n=1 Tax=Marasmius oreades TaxID=181124 RepID=A0A9P7S387_9AGAR|nr:uncharacterized protein E1B28_007958 [Marasmius oreades]KAG7094358.1 hypothetical protein E1B28_007958 [Marasmius oreades]